MTMTPEIENDPFHTAIHEASHAVIGRVLTLACGGATIVPDYEAGGAGYSITEDPYICGSEWAKRGKARDIDTVWHARIMTYMAGAEGEVELIGSTQGGDGDDRYQIELMAEELVAHKNWKLLELRLRAMTRMLVRRHRVLIERVAAGLLDRKTLSREELDDLVGRSVDDVKVNAPFLLMMHRERERSA
jgi:ATP-dependent Zn protease